MVTHGHTWLHSWGRYGKSATDAAGGMQPPSGASLRACRGECKGGQSHYCKGGCKRGNGAKLFDYLLLTKSLPVGALSPERALLQRSLFVLHCPGVLQGPEDAQQPAEDHAPGGLVGSVVLVLGYCGYGCCTVLGSTMLGSTLCAGQYMRLKHVCCTQG
jgi:hypothetical protein